MPTTANLLLFATAAVAIGTIGYEIHRHNVNKKRQNAERAANAQAIG